MSAELKRLTYVGYYDVTSNEVENRNYSPAAVQKMDYILWTLARLGYATEVVSASRTGNKRCYGGNVVPLEHGNALRLFPTLPWGGKLRRVTSVLYTRVALLLWLLRSTERDEDVVVYHSLGYAGVVGMARRMRGFRLVLEVEEVYADVTGNRRDRRIEDRLFRRASAFILPTHLLADAIGVGERPYAVVHGTYAVEPMCGERFTDSRIHVVYAGTLDPRKGVLTAVSAARLLDARFHLHVLGFGRPSEVAAVRNMVQESCDDLCRVSYEGVLSGQNYGRFLQRCEIGLSPQGRSAEFNDTSFPSKVLSYLVNGLQVVSIRIDALEQSAVGDLIHFYDEDTPEAVADAIMRVDLQIPNEVPRRLQELDASFARDLRGVLS